jgi:hypothetical protein
VPPEPNGGLLLAGPGSPHDGELRAGPGTTALGQLLVGYGEVLDRIAARPPIPPVPLRTRATKTVRHRSRVNRTAAMLVHVAAWTRCSAGDYGRAPRTEPHSMLVYGKGQFFLPHQDSEKDDAMVGTLVVSLPSAHTGGELVVGHAGESKAYRVEGGADLRRVLCRLPA